MFTSSGMGMAVGVAWCFVAIITFILSLVIKKSNKKWIYGVTLSLIFILLALYFLLDSMPIAFVATVIATGQISGLLIKIATTRK
ncbi:MAG: hypothetical protein ACERKO_03075 [Acetanaerobacterium sp.]